LLWINICVNQLQWGSAHIRQASVRSVKFGLYGS
jgi:hypothetical protein